ncbi:hypothetical protein, partial [Streptococcus agalactiae]|uniref:hypothetical protein n=1 Tax=Streptococcus agalactiae TaxID=1311 RepID=UPI0030101A33
DDAHTVAAALPRTVDLADQGFLWLHSDPDGPGGYARIVAGTADPADTADTAESGGAPEAQTGALVRTVSLTVRQILA